MDYFNELSGVNESREPKAIINMVVNGKEYIVYKPVVDIKEIDDYLQIDMIFDVEKGLDEIWYYYQIINGQDDNDEIDFIFIQKKSINMMHLVAKKPIMWAITTNDINLGLNTIRLLFKAESCELFMKRE